MRDRLKTAVQQIQQFLPKSRADKARNLLSPVAVVAANENSQQALVFGLMWQSIVDDKSRQEAVQIARQRGATHTTSQGLQSGFALVLPGDIRPGEKLYAASRIAARKYGGDALFVVMLSSDLHWLALVRNGQPSAQDQLFASAEEACEAARQIFDGLQSDGVHLKVYSDEENLGISSAVPFEQITLMEAVDDSSEPLVAIKPRQLPVRVVVGVVAIALLMLGFKGYDIYRAKQRAKAIALANAAEGNSVKVWEQAVADWAATITTARGTGISQAREALTQKMPAAWNGWILEQAGCVAAQATPAPAPGGASKRMWTCNARYVPGPAASVTRELEATKPAGWSMSYPNLSLALASFSLIEETKSLIPDQLNTVAHHQVETISTLQPLRPALSEDIPFVFEVVPVPPPLDRNGVAIAPPPEIPTFRRLNLSVKGPLRSLDAVFASPVEVDWTELRLTSVQAYPDSPIESGLTISAVSAEAKGTLYARQ